MSNKNNNAMSIFKKVFIPLLVLDLIGLIFTVISLFSTFRQLAGYGQMMIIVASMISGVTVVVSLFEILCKVLLVRSTSPAFSWVSARKTYMISAKLLLLFNFFAVVFNILSIGGEGATIINQGYTYLRIVASIVEIIAVIFYMRTAKKLVKDSMIETEGCK